MDNVFETIRNRLDMLEVVKFYGLEVDRKGFACCPFHGDKTPSLKIYPDHFYCFGCGTTGDAAGFVAKLFDIKQLDAAKKLSYDFGLGLFEREIAVPAQTKAVPENDYRRWAVKAQQSLNDYLNKLYQWRKKYCPKNPNDEPHPLFVESLTKTDYAEYLYGILAYGSEQDKKEMYNSDHEGITQIQTRLAEIAARERNISRSGRKTH